MKINETNSSMEIDASLAFHSSGVPEFALKSNDLPVHDPSVALMRAKVVQYRLPG